MNVEKAYNLWAEQYDSNNNKTRDLEAIAKKEALTGRAFKHCLEIGCGTGKNTGFLLDICDKVTAVDLSEEMLSQARQKHQGQNVEFIKADINGDWDFASEKYDLVTFSLVLEHIEDLDNIFRKVREVTCQGTLVYTGELHPFKQYLGTKARFESEAGQTIVTCFNHNVSDFTSAALSNGFKVVEIREYFDDEQAVPRIFVMICQGE
jgi:ubiquinone/menaquinone biosynthesis C-methylase UbiE